jgi:hypothetical protein
MGYRSEVTILTSGETAKLEAFKQAMLLRYRNKNTLDLVKDCLGANEGDRFCDCEYWDNSGFAFYCSAFHDIKWYTEAQEWFDEYKNFVTRLAYRWSSCVSVKNLATLSIYTMKPAMRQAAVCCTQKQLFVSQVETN